MELVKPGGNSTGFLLFNLTRDAISSVRTPLKAGAAPSPKESTWAALLPLHRPHRKRPPDGAHRVLHCRNWPTATTAAFPPCGGRRAFWVAHMMDDSEPRRFLVNIQELPTDFPTHKHASEFWEALGRTVATFGYLEETLGKAIFAFTAMRRIPPNEQEAEFERWLPTLERALIDPLGGLIDSYAERFTPTPVRQSPISTT